MWQITLGRTDLHISPIGLGCWQFSAAKGFSRFFWPVLEQETVKAIVATSLAGGINWFDTAEVYGNGASEKALALSLQALGIKSGEIIIATKWFPLSRTARSILQTFPRREAALAPYPIDLYQIHMPLSFSSIERQLEQMAYLFQQQKIKAIGVSNFSRQQMEQAAKALARFGLSLASNQVRYNLLDRQIEKNGVLEYARQLRTTIIAYSPLAQGLLSGKFHANPKLLSAIKGGRRLTRFFNRQGLELTRPLIDVLQQIASKYEVSPSEVALSWLILKNRGLVAAIPGASKPEHAAINCRALKLVLSEDEIGLIDEISQKLDKKHIQKKPGF